MRKLTDRYRRWLYHRAASEARQHARPNVRRRTKRKGHEVMAWSGFGMERVIAQSSPRIPPRSLCFDLNTVETLKFFAEWREASKVSTAGGPARRYGWFQKPRRVGGLRRIESYIDYSKIEFLSTAAAVIFAADYDRMRQLSGCAPPTINIMEWSDHVFNKLFEVGFFEIVGLADDVSDRYRDDGTTRTMRILSGSDAAKIKEASERLIDLSRFISAEDILPLDVLVALNSALSEAMINVSRHAYPADHKFQYRHIGKWWVTAEADQADRSLTIVIYDQGASIPITFPKKAKMAAIRDSFSRLVSKTPAFDFEDDGAYIAQAMEPGSTQTGEGFRGYGLPQMKELVDICGSGRITIFSRGGICQYEPGHVIKHSSHPHSIGGTLIEWIIRLPEHAHG